MATTRPTTKRDATVVPRERDNYVFLRGRLAAEAIIVALPSGDEICSFRLVVDRPDGVRGRVDTVDCRAGSARVRTTIERAAPGTELELSGSLRRRFWRGQAGVQSRYEVDVSAAKVSRSHRQGT